MDISEAEQTAEGAVSESEIDGKISTEEYEDYDDELIIRYELDGNEHQSHYIFDNDGHLSEQNEEYFLDMLATRFGYEP